VASGEWLAIGVVPALELLELLGLMLEEDGAATLELLARLLEDDETATLELLARLLELGTATDELLGMLEELLEPVLPHSDSGISFTSSLYAAFLLPLASKSKGFLLLRHD